MSHHVIVNVRRLHDRWLWKNFSDMFKYSKIAEVVVCDAVARERQMILESITQGKDTRYDVMMSGKKIEVKYQTSRNLSIEFAHADGTPSGISVTEADHYVMVNIGSSLSKITGEWYNVGKIRLIPVHLLKDAVERKKATDTRVWPGYQGPGSLVVELDPKKDLPRDGWVKDIVITENEQGHVLYDFGPPEMCHSAVLEKAYTQLQCIR